MTRQRGLKIARLGLMTIALVLVAAFVCHASTITGLTVKKTDEIVEIHVGATGPVNYHVISTNKPRQALVVEMSPASALNQVVKTIQIDKGIIERAKIERESGKVRLIVEVLQPVKYMIKAAPGNQGIVLTVGTQTISAKVSKAVTKMGAGEPTMEGPEPVKPPVGKPIIAANKPYSHKDLTPKPKRKYYKPVKLVSIDFVNADLIYVLKLLAKELDTNLVTDDSVTGSVTMSLKNVSAQTAMNIIIKMNGFKQKKMGNILFVGSDQTMNAITPDVIAYQPTGDVEMRVFRLQNISAGDAVSTVKASYPMVQVNPSPQGNAVIVNANKSMLNEIQSLLKGIDIPRPEGPAQISEKVEVVRMKYTDADGAVALLKTLLGSDAPATMEIDKRLNAIVFKGYEAQIARAKEQLEDIDIPLQQVMLSVKVVDLSETGAKNLGVAWQAGTGTDATQPVKWFEIPNGYPANTGGAAFNPYTTAPPTYGDSGVGFFVRNPFVLSSALSLQITQGDAKVLASPRVAALDGKEATIHIGDRYPIVYYDPRAGQYQVIYVDIGIRLTVKPTISPDGYISSEINTTVSDLRELIANQYPRTTERSANLTIRVKDNNTIVIGGMIQESSRQNVRKVPLLGDIPILGEMFKQTTTDRNKGEVVIMITPKIITQ